MLALLLVELPLLMLLGAKYPCMQTLCTIIVASECRVASNAVESEITPCLASSVLRCV
jgi:hypothetical protein